MQIKKSIYTSKEYTEAILKLKEQVEVKCKQEYEKVYDELWEFVSSEDEHTKYMEQYEGDYESLNDLLHKLTYSIVDLHRKAYNIGDYTIIYSDNISCCCDEYNENKYFGKTFIEVLDDLNKMNLTQEEAKTMGLKLFGECFEYITNGINKDYEQLKKEYYDFHESVCDFWNQLEEIVVHTYDNVDSPEHKTAYQIRELFDNIVKL